VLCKSVSWRDVPAEQVGCSGVTAWRRLRDWTEAGVWPRLHEVLLAELRQEGLVEMDDAAIDGSHVRALKGGSHRTFAGRPCPPGQQAPPHRRPAWNPTRCLSDRRKPSRRHPAHAAAGRHPTHPRVTGPDTQPAPAAVRRPRLRLRQVPPPRPGSGDHTEDRPPRHPARFRAGQDQMGRRADLVRHEALCLYPRLSREELGRRFLGRMTYLDPKGEGDNSMSENQ
jgi:hypothetical protein